MLGRFDPNIYTKVLYHLEDLNDSSGGGHTLTKSSSATFSPGPIGNQGNFTGNQAYASHGDIAGIDFSAPYTIFGIFTPNSFDTTVKYPIRIIGPVGTVGFYLYYSGSNQTITLINRTLSTTVNWTPVLGKRYPFVISSDGSYSSFFITGRKLISSGPAGTASTSPAIWLGGYKTDWGLGKCWLDEIHIQQKHYTDAQIMRYLGQICGRLL